MIKEELTSHETIILNGRRYHSVSFNCPSMFKSRDDVLDCRFQKAGFLIKLPFMGGGRWQKRWFVLKDGYLLYYGSFKKSTEKFDQHPRGAIPLGNCTIECCDDVPKVPSGYFAFRASHANFGGGTMTLACAGKDERDELLAMMRDCRRITYENALLGDAMITKLNNKGALLEAGQESDFKEFEATALKHREEREAFEQARAKLNESGEVLADVQKAMERKAALASKATEEHAALLEELKAQEEEAFRLDEENKKMLEEQERLAREGVEAEEQLLGVAEEAANMEEQRLSAEKHRVEAAQNAAAEEAELQKKMEELLQSKDGLETRLEKELLKRKKAEIKLKMAQESVRRLDSALKRSGATVDRGLSNDVKNLMSFFEQQVDNLKNQVNYAENVKMGLRQQKDYSARARQLSASMK